MTTRAIALLDRPNRLSFGITPIVIEDGPDVRVVGLAPASAYRAQATTASHVGELVRGGHALEVSAAVSADLGPTTVALWLGEEFAAKASALDLSPPPLPSQTFTAEGGTYFLGPADVMYPYLETWTLRAFRRLLLADGDRRRDIASLMQWVLPDHPKTLAAAWTASANRDRELQLQVRTFVRGRSVAELKTDHERVLAARPEGWSDLRLVVFAGVTGAGRESVAKRFAGHFALPITSFAQSLEERYREELTRVPGAERKRVLMVRGQREVDTSPLALALAPLRAVPRTNVLVVDGLRHIAIRDALRWLEPNKVFVVGVTVDETVRAARLLQRALDPADLLRDRTEREIPNLTGEADYRVDESVPDSKLLEIYEALQA